MRFAKHHGLGNTFLVLIDPEATALVDGALARAACDGLGADGLIHVTAAPAGVRMVLHNADGSRAEVSGNGLRCVAQAVLRAGLVEGPDVVVLTDAGLRLATVAGDPAADDTVGVRVDMGPATELDDAPYATLPGGPTPQKAVAVSMGNPHRVLLFADAGEVAGAVAALPPIPDVNVELVVPGPGPDAVTMRVVERGVGETLACGTGACAAAWAAHRWGLAGERVTVHQRGGDAAVEVGETLTLEGPATFEGFVEWR